MARLRWRAFVPEPPRHKANEPRRLPSRRECKRRPERCRPRCSLEPTSRTCASASRHRPLSDVLAFPRFRRLPPRPFPRAPAPAWTRSAYTAYRLEPLTPVAAHARHHSCVFLLQHRPRQPVAAVLSLIMVRMLVATRNRISELEGPRRTKQHAAWHVSYNLKHDRCGSACASLRSSPSRSNTSTTSTTRRAPQP